MYSELFLWGIYYPIIGFLYFYNRDGERERYIPKDKRETRHFKVKVYGQDVSRKAVQATDQALSLLD